ncbi:hypothetical protein [Zooshikella harenae]|uniref:Uncharacterized protein n=1 Tax=Zooshikella harenae TaxID=2827238 RepID=A0ABS5ZE04_9GAMM|nr:hypothetical protein [Zooshikella harenae]MBU2712301.1 hypothetical protein [Zooshikella harenae]
MHQKVPTTCLKLHKLGEVPRSAYMDSQTTPSDLIDAEKRSFFFKLLRSSKPQKAVPPPTKKVKHSLKLNAVVWLNFITPPKQTISFLLVYKDASGEFGVIVEEAPPSSSTSMMLSNTVDIEYLGDIEYLRACCTGLSKGESVMVESLSIKPAQTTDKLASQH